MSGPTAIKSKKTLLTRYCNRLNEIVAQCEGDLSDGTTVEDAKAYSDYIFPLILELRATSKLVSDQLDSFVNVIDSLGDSLSTAQEDQTQEYIGKAQNSIDRAEKIAIQLDSKRLGALEAQRGTTQGRSLHNRSTTQVETAAPKLPAIPIPTFDGKIWEYANFWTLFNANVHNQPSLSNLQKFNHLISALRGDARELVRRYPVTEENYDLAIELLRKKYNDNSHLINALQSRLEHATAEKPTTQAQRKLLESIVPVVTQLQNLGVDLNGSYNAQKLLAKFAIRIQRRVLEHSLATDKEESQWTMKSLLEIIDSTLSTEERVNDMLSRRGYDTSISANNTTVDKRSTHQATLNTSPCMFCKSYVHKPINCSKYPTIEERRTFLQKNNMCLNCGRHGHFVKDCTSDGCRNCQGKKHNHVLCPQRMESQRQGKYQSKTPLTKPALPTTPKQSTSSAQRGKSNMGPPNGRDAQAHSLKTRSLNDGISKEETNRILTENFKSVLYSAQSATQREDADVLLSTGIARVWNTQRRSWRPVEILFDTGADQSFINQNLVEELGLHYTETRQYDVFTFGSDTPTTKSYAITTLDLWDNQQNKHNLRLCATTVLTGKGTTMHLSQQDLDFITSNNIQLSKKTGTDESSPEILLGCDQLWNLLNVPEPKHTLPSGLQLIPSKLGYLLTGKQQLENKDEVRDFKTTPSLLNVVQSIADEEDDIQRWEKYWTIDSAGVCEFMGTKNAEKAAVNEQVLNFFNSTIERRDDGYYVRLPYKENHPPLPTNKAIAIKRLHSVLKMLKAKPMLLDEYDEIFRAQLEKHIIEEVPDPKSAEGAVVHYIPHQPVITPQKQTTKLRIVFDASSHFKDHPSLNDVLHQGPIILPELYAMLLRFRVSRYVVTSDVEKAFLQVRLHELDRDATRFFWIRDCKLDPIDSNIVTYRFTRVTFGLNVSPFLLKATVQYHLRNSVHNEELGREIQENLYVDNLIIAAETRTDVLRKATCSRDIFADMGMNLREFLSNDEGVNKKLPSEARATSRTQKVLGILWDSNADKLTIRCDLPQTTNLTKRIVARQIASIYDPFGWLVPLLTKAKHFQQMLWKSKYAWDTVLPTALHEEWNHIITNVTGFSHSFERRLLRNPESMQLAIFADASTIAMSTCAYIFNDEQSTLIMAKCKLPSIKSTPTIPKLEINALTLGTRLAFSIVQALNERINHPFKIHIFSDSQIALSWLSASGHKSNSGLLVTNRLKEIKRIVEALHDRGISVQFKFVQTGENPADSGTRGLTKTQLTQTLWWNGPGFLRTPEHTWPTPTYHINFKLTPSDQHEPIYLNHVHVNQQTTSPLFRCERYSSLLRAQRVIAIALVFLKKTMERFSELRKNSIYEHIPDLRHIPNSLHEIGGNPIRAARRILIRDHQTSYLTEDYIKTTENTLRPFRDSAQLWRSRGRIGNSNLQTNAKSPIMIFPNTALSNLIIREAHGTYHCGIEHTIASTRMQYWIPKLRQQVRHMVKNCVVCRRFNGLPYAYPPMQDLPERRVIRSRTFEHIGIDFFDLPTIKEDDKEFKVYGCIFTCTVTRLIHLELVRSISIEDFINALRRFIARRGLPASITSDNAPTFLLGACILAKDTTTTDMHPAIRRASAQRGIEWKNITPYAPWQGGFYERLIKSIKHALYKSLRGTPCRTLDQLNTLLTEIEACLNSRPLTYQGAEQEQLESIRPIDFLQRDLILEFPYDTSENEEEPEYLPSDQLKTPSTRKEAEEALRSSCRITDRFWKIWQENYLTSLRDAHKKYISSKRQHQLVPRVGSVVLISDPIHSRNEWRMARITKAQASADGHIREVELVTGTKRKIRRPVNLIIPMELDENADIDEQHAQHDSSQNIATPAEELSPASDILTENRRYNLRPRKSRHIQTLTANTTQSTTCRKWFLFYVMIFSLICRTGTSEIQSTMTMTCTEKGLRINNPINSSFEVCADNRCELYRSTGNAFTIKFPPEVTLHDHAVSLKWETSGHISVMETVCPSLNFCQNIDCVFCATILLNPECWPLGAIFVAVLLLYAITTLLYLLLYVPMTIGKPIRIMTHGTIIMLWTLLRLAQICLHTLPCLFKRRTRSRRERISDALALAILLAASSYSMAQACQHVNILEYKSTICTQTEGKENCSISLSEVLKINSFQQEACLRLTKNSTLLMNIKIRWKGLYLKCDHQTLYYTRSTELRVFDSKRCPHMGSCSGNKCADINSLSIIPELQGVSQFPGRTGCLESCGGPGCDCFYLSSGCLFYRLYAIPRSNKIYEVFRCSRWQESIKLDIILENPHGKQGRKHYVSKVIPNIPLQIDSFEVTLTSITLPPTPSLNHRFISTENETALWKDLITPHLICDSWISANTTNCTSHDDCHCAAAESIVSCQCSQRNIDEEFDKIELKLPIETPSIGYRRQRGSPVTAKISEMVSADLILNMKSSIYFDNTAIIVTQQDCSVENNALIGCYNCAKGAFAKVKCRSKSDTLGDIICNDNAFVIPCALDAPESLLRFNFDRARQQVNCTVQCGAILRHFTLSGVLKYVNGFNALSSYAVSGNSTHFNAIKWPDFAHIFEVLCTSYKTLVFITVGVGLIIFLIYISLQPLSLAIITITLRSLKFIVHLLARLMLLPLRLLKFFMRKTLQQDTHANHYLTHEKEH